MTAIATRVTDELHALLPIAPPGLWTRLEAAFRSEREAVLQEAARLFRETGHDGLFGDQWLVQWFPECFADWKRLTKQAEASN